MIHYLTCGPYHESLAFWLRALAVALIGGLVAAIVSVWLLSCWFEAHANTTARVQRLERQVAYLEGSARPLVKVGDGGHVSIIAGVGE